MPGAAIRIRLRIGCLREGGMHLLNVLGRGRPVGRRAHQWVTKPHERADLKQAGIESRYRGTAPERAAS